ncbi:MAG: sensor histidine kinase, partial [Bacilli bacterium]|nr:sensor histidine kinase [Bacilli bacterium]
VDAKQIMERFYRSPSNKKEGSGVGLSIAQEIINLHKGKINVEKNNWTLSFLITF